MSNGEEEIICRRCQEIIPLREGNCPHCGTAIRSAPASAVVFGFGLLLAGASLFALSELWFFGLIGLAMAATGGYLLYDRRRRMRQAAGESA